MINRKASPAMTQVIVGMLRATRDCVNDSVKPLHTSLLEQFEMELEYDKLKAADIYEPFEPGMGNGTKPYPKQPLIDLSAETDTLVRFWYALGAEIADFSCLGRGIRPFTDALWESGFAEDKKRGLKSEFFCDWELT